MTELKRSELTQEEVNLLTDQIENLSKSRTELVKNRDLIEQELSKVTKLLTALRLVTKME